MDPLSQLAAIALSLIVKSEANLLAPEVDGIAHDAFVGAWSIDHPIAIKGFDEGDRRLFTAALGVVAAYREARFRSNPKGPNDAGAACGVLQTHIENLRYGTCAEARASRLRGMQEGLAYLVDRIEACNPGKREFTENEIVRGLGAYATGVCGGWAVHARSWCRKAGLCH